MSVYLVVATKVEGGEIVEADVRKVTKDAASGEIGFAEKPGVLDRAALANLVIMEDVFAVKDADPPGTYGFGQRCRRKPGPMEYITTVDEHGVPTDDLLKLPKLQ